MEKIEKLIDRYIIIVILLASLPAVWALLVPGYYGASDDLHIAWLFEMIRALSTFQIPPRFVPDLSYQFGYPLFNFVFPLPYYIASIFYYFGLNLVDSIKFLFLLSVPLSAIGMYFLVRALGASVIVSLSSALIYVYSPYRAVDLYIRGAIGEIVSFVFFPIIVLSIIKILKEDQKSWRWVGVGGLGLGALVLTHNIAAYMFLPFLLLLILLLLALKKFELQKIFRVGWLFLLGGLVSIYFWLPAIVESKLMKYDTVFNFYDHFPTIRQLLLPYWGYGASVAGPYDGMSFYIGLSNLLAFLFGLVIFIITLKKFSHLERVVLIWAGIVFGGSFLMMNYRAGLIWEVVPMLPYFQFPWRFLILMTFITPLFLIGLNHFRYKYVVCGLLILCIGTFNLGYFRPQDFLGRDDEYYLNKYIPVPTESEEYRNHQEEYLRLPIATQKRPETVREKIEVESGISVSNIKHSLLNIEFVVESSSPGKVSYNKYYFPGWVGRIDGENLELRAGSPYGQIEASVPDGRHRISFEFREDIYKRILDLISVGGFLILIYLIVDPRALIFRKAG